MYKRQRYVYRDCLHRFVRFAVNVMGVAPGANDAETALRGIEATENFFRALKMPTNFRELGIAPTPGDLEEMARKCAIAAGGCQGSAKPLREKDMMAIYEMAM